MKTLLRAWEERSTQLTSLDVKIQRIDRSPAWGDEEFEGRAMLVSPNLVWLDFKRVEVDPKSKNRKAQPYERIVCTGTEVWQYQCDVKRITIFPLDKKDQKRALEEGPLPFLFNMRAADAEARYQMSLFKETKDHYVISVVPLLPIDQQSFLSAFLQLSKASYLPDRIALIAPDGKSSKEFWLKEVRPNLEIPLVNFRCQKLGPPWEIRIDDGKMGGGAGAAPAAPGVGSRQPAAAPAGLQNRRR
jgi:TIGR03009 family protein